MPAPSPNLVWIDLEMTGLSPEDDRIIEIASLVTDSALNILAEGPVLAVRQSLERLAGMDEWNTRHHTASGLVASVRESTIDEAEAERQTLEFLRPYASPGQAPLCGNSVCQDRRFLAAYMPELNAWLHYRHVDVSSIQELAARWRPDLARAHTKRNTHRALDDIRESVAELRYYRDCFMRADSNG